MSKTFITLFLVSTLGLSAFAQVEMWKQKQWQSPYYWAAFTMQGEWR